MSKWDKDYIKLCKKILKEGKEVENRTGINTIKIPGYEFEFDLSKNVVIIFGMNGNVMIKVIGMQHKCYRIKVVN